MAKILYKSRVAINDPYIFAGSFFLAASLIVPTTYQAIRLMLLFLWLFLSIVDANGIFSIPSKAWGVLVCYVGYNIVSFLWGMANEAPGAVDNLRPYVIWPVIFPAITLRIRDGARVKSLVRILLFIEFIICCSDIWYCFADLGLMFPYPSILNKIEMGYHFNPGWITFRFSTYHVCTHIFMIPFTVALMMEDYYSKRHRLWIYVLVALEAVSLFLSGRIALELSTAAAVVVLLVLRRWLRGKKIMSKWLQKTVVLAGLSVLAIAIFTATHRETIANTVQAISNKLVNSFTENDTADGVRMEQAKALANGWLKSPLIGNGSGSYPKESIRDKEHPWYYEMTYFAILYQSGLLGIFVFLGLVLYILVSILKGVKRKCIEYENGIPFVVGLIGILAATYVDPYLFKMGCMWMVFIPFGIAALAERKIGYADR